MKKQLTSEILMIRPVAFRYNEQTAVNNAFQDAEKIEGKSITQEKALGEFDSMVDLLRKNNINVTVVEDTLNPHTPDSIFPNNWISFHKSGKVILYPMFAVNRRAERRQDILDKLKENFIIDNIIDLSHFEKEDKFLESTGSLIFDRINQVAFACYSPRTHQEVIDEFSAKVGVEIITFSAFDQSQEAIYHTNVMMTIGENLAVICLESITDEKEKIFIEDKLRSLSKYIIDISFEQMNSFAGNMLEIQNQEGQNFLIMSKTAFDSLEKNQIESIEKHAKILAPDIPTIENNGGGSVRCMVAEIFLPKHLNNEK